MKGIVVLPGEGAVEEAVTDLPVLIPEGLRFCASTLSTWARILGIASIAGVAAAPAVAPAAPPATTTYGPPRSTKVQFVADSNIFMDRVEGGPTQRQWITDHILNNPDVILYVPNTAYNEATYMDPYGTQATRLAGGPGKATIIRTADGDLSKSLIPGNTGPVDIVGLASRNFTENDMRIVRRAQELNLPLLTTNNRLYSQIFQSNIPQRKDEFGRVII
jgi:hypothetical protein